MDENLMVYLDERKKQRQQIHQYQYSEHEDYEAYMNKKYSINELCM